ncbi:restriction endonuclease subunit S [Vibrio artabrorum]|uniref:restriction endonuclease subunit S n=1 Tax=Vibrio artabrorum TaxID=446374 RepID=UPI00354E2127
MKDQNIPDGWQIVKFGEIAKQISKRIEPSETDLNIYIGLEHLDPGSLKINRHGVPGDVKGQKLLVKKGQIIFGKRRAYQRKVAIAGFDCICSAHAMVLEANTDKIVTDFLPFFIQSDEFMNRAVAISEGSLSPTIKWKVLANQEFMIPSLEKQEASVEVLRGITNDLEHIELALESAYNLKQSVLANFLLKGIGNKSFIDSKFGSYPENWQLVTVGDLTLEHKQGFYTTEKYAAEGCYLVRISDLDNPRVIFDEMPRLKVDTKTIEQFKVEKGDFLFARSGTIGRYGIYDSEEEAIFASYVIRFRFNEKKILTSYFGYFYESILCARQLRGIAQQGSNVNINAENIKKLKVPLPSIDEQKEILKIINEVELSIEKLNNKIETTKILVKSLSQEMIGG